MEKMSLVLVARLMVIAVLGYSGWSKLGSTEVGAAARDLGLSPRIAKWVGRWLAPAELLVAGLLFFGATGYAGAVAALALFAGFAALIAWNLWQGKKPVCACFGDARAEAISNRTLIRDLLFVALAAVLVADGTGAIQQGVIAGLVLGISEFGPSVALAMIGLAQAATLLVLMAERGRSQSSSALAAHAPAVTQATGWPPGTIAPAFDLPSLEGTRVTLEGLIAPDRAVILFFTAPDCRHCGALFPEIARWQEAYASVLTLAIVARGSGLENRDQAEGFAIRKVLLQGGTEVAEAYQATTAPAAVVVDPARRIASRVATGAVEIRQLVEAWAERLKRDAPVSVLSPAPPADPTRLLIGDPAPPFKLPSLRGGDVDLGEFGGRMTVLVFWNPACGFCRGLAPGLRARETEQTESSAQMVFVAAGTRAANEAERFVSPVLLDGAGDIAEAYGSTGTPSSLLIDADGNVASALAVGQGQIENLLQRADMMVRAARRLQA